MENFRGEISPMGEISRFENFNGRIFCIDEYCEIPMVTPIFIIIFIITK